MKKGISLVLVLVMCLSLCACGKSQSVNVAETQESMTEAQEENEKLHIFEISKTAYECLCKAYEMTDTISRDLYEGWRIGVKEGKELLNSGNCAEYLTQKMDLTEDELREGVAYLYISTHSQGVDYDWEDATEEDKEKFRAYDYGLFNYYNNHGKVMFSSIVWVVQDAYTVNGYTEEINANLDLAKASMRELSEKYSDYEHYPSLKNFYTETSAFFDFCMDCTGVTFDQAAITIKDYRDNARNYKNDLDFIFGE